MSRIKCLKCGSFDVEIDDIGLTCREDFLCCTDCDNDNQASFEEIFDECD